MIFSCKITERKNGKVSKCTITQDEVAIEYAVAKSGLILFNEKVVGKLHKPQQKWYENRYFVKFFEQ